MKVLSASSGLVAALDTKPNLGGDQKLCLPSYFCESVYNFLIPGVAQPEAPVPLVDTRSEPERPL